MSCISLIREILADYNHEYLNPILQYFQSMANTPILKFKFGVFNANEWCNIWSFIPMDYDLFSIYSLICKEMNLVLQRFCKWNLVLFPFDSQEIFVFKPEKWKLFEKQMMCLFILSPFSTNNEFIPSLIKFLENHKCLKKIDFMFHMIQNPCPKRLMIRLKKPHQIRISDCMNGSLLNDTEYIEFSHGICYRYDSLLKNLKFVYLHDDFDFGWIHKEMNVSFSSLKKFLSSKNENLNGLEILHVRIPLELQWNPKVNLTIVKCKEKHPCKIFIEWQSAYQMK